MSNEKAQAYWNANEQAIKDVCKFEGPKGVVYDLFRTHHIVPRGESVTDEMRELHRLYHLAPKGAPVDFNEDVELPGHKISENRSSAPVRVSFDAAEGDGRVWLMDPDDNWIAVEGESNARELARLLLAWADTYETAEGAQ